MKLLNNTETVNLSYAREELVRVLENSGLIDSWVITAETVSALEVTIVTDLEERIIVDVNELGGAIYFEEDDVEILAVLDDTYTFEIDFANEVGRQIKLSVEGKA